jgi:outer membrane protein, heavy metal efflux system
MKLAVAGKALDLTLEVRRSFLSHQAAIQLLDLQRVALAAARSSWETARQLQEAGNIPDLRAATEEADYEQARLGVAAAELAVELSRERLGALLGLWGDSSWSIQAGLPGLPEGEVELVTLEGDALRRSLDLRIAEHHHAAAAQRADIAAVTGWLPDLSLGVEAQREQQGWEIGPELGLEVPLFYQNQGERASAEAAMRRQEQRHRALAVQIRAAARAVGARLVAARDRVRFYEEILLPLRQKVLDETQLQYNAMATSVFELLRAKRIQVDAERAHVEALRDYWLARAETEQLLAGRLVRTMPRDATSTAMEE